MRTLSGDTEKRSLLAVGGPHQNYSAALMNGAAGRGIVRDRLAINLDLAELNVAACAMTAARHQIDKTYFVNFAQVWIGNPGFVGRRGISAEGNHAVIIEFEPPEPH